MVEGATGVTGTGTSMVGALEVAGGVVDWEVMAKTLATGEE